MDIRACPQGILKDNFAMSTLASLIKVIVA
jgi:hypothetical protein